MKKHLLELKRTRSGTYRNTSSGLFLDRNERVLPYDEETLEMLYQRVSKIALNLYPDLFPFYQKLSQWLEIREEQIFVTEGVSGAIKPLVETLTEAGSNVVFPTPTFAMYPVYCQMFNLEYRTVGYTKNYKLNIDQLLNQIDENTAIVFLPNPNNPIEGTLDLDTLVFLAEYCLDHNVYLVIDEVYYPYGGPTAIDLIERFDNLFIMRSFSKAFGLAGIRVGYLLGTRKNIEYVSKTRTGYESNTISMEIASFFIDHFHLVEEYIHCVKEGLTYLKNQLNKLDLEYNGGESSNFVYVDLCNQDLVKKMVEDLRSKNIYIRGGWPEPYAKGIAITGAPKEMMIRFFEEFSTTLFQFKH